MCGIFGYIALEGGAADPALLEQGLSTLRHRGPDDSGTLLDGPLGMGAMRLAVIDRDGGHQPLANEDGSVSVVFNGEIFNYSDLRRDLIERGHHFRTESDTEVLVHLYEEDPDGFLPQLNGMFALAIWDRNRRRLVLARDRTGIKPLFVSQWQGAFFFSSEMKALLGLPDFPAEWDYQALNDYFSFYYVSAPRTLYRQIRRVMPGEYLTIESGKITSGRFWDYSFQHEPGRRLESYVEEYTDLLEQSVKRHLQSEVPVGVFLSGGLDSASIVAMMSRHQSTINTYSVGYQEDSYSELGIAGLISRQFQTNHHAFILTPELLTELLPRVIDQLDEPHGDWTHVAISHLSQMVRDDVTVVLSGAGGG
ncbi:asparagine synthase (glutamine-hydrolyzing) [Gemmatimonadota bacterium]